MAALKIRLTSVFDSNKLFEKKLVDEGTCPEDKCGLDSGSTPENRLSGRVSTTVQFIAFQKRREIVNFLMISNHGSEFDDS